MTTDSNATSSFSFHPLGLGAVLKLHRLAVPLYQREYSWDGEMVQQLFSDLSKAMQEGSDYFLGTVVTIPRPKSEILDVVDGQQRLTTTAIFLAAVRDFVLKSDPSNLIVESIENEFLSIIDRKQGKRVPRLQLNADDRTFFDNLIGRDPTNLHPTRESHRRLVEAKDRAARFVAKLVQAYDLPQQMSLLNDWIGFLEAKANVILLKAPDSQHAFRMFETLNDRGLKTSQADLVKNYLFEQAGEERVVEAQKFWSSMLNTLEDIDDDDRRINFLRHALIATRAFTRADRVFGTVQSRVKGETNAIQFLSDLERLSSIYVATYKPDSDHWTGYPLAARKAVSVLKLVDLKPLRPLLLSVIEKFEPKEGAQALALLVSVVVRILIASRTASGQIEQVCASAALAVYEGKISKTKELKKALERITPSDDQFRQMFETATVSKAALARYYLRSLQLVQDNDSEPWFEPTEDTESITLEHILPKNPKDGEWQSFSEEEVKRFSRRIGNLCLLQKTTNSNLKSAEFEEKKAVFAKSPYDFTKTVAVYRNWTTETIEARQKELASMAVRAWPIR